MRTVFVFLCFYFSLVYCEDQCKDDEVRKVERNVVGTIPTLFAYVLNRLQERPEILEKNDVTLFTENHGNESEESNESFGNEVSIDRYGESDELLIKMNTVYRFVGLADTVSSLTPEEVAEQVLRVEQRLEEYNKLPKT